MQFGGDVGGRPRRACGTAPAQSAAIIGNCRSKVRNRLLNVKPVQIGGCNPGFKEHGVASRSLLHKVEPASAADVDPPAPIGIASAVSARAQLLIHNACDNQGCKESEKVEKQVHAVS